MKDTEKSKGSNGKNFERQFKLSAEHQEILIIRLNDSDLSFNPFIKEHTRFTAKNPCDFIIYNYPNIFFLELKSTIYNSISIQNNPEESKMIKLHQINSLKDLSLTKGVYSGFIFNFKDKETIEEDTYYLSIENFLRFLNETGKKSISKLNVVQYGGIKINQKLKRTQYLYNIQELLDQLKEGKNGL